MGRICIWTKAGVCQQCNIVMLNRRVVRDCSAWPGYGVSNFNPLTIFVRNLNRWLANNEPRGACAFLGMATSHQVKKSCGGVRTDVHWCYHPYREKVSRMVDWSKSNLIRMFWWKGHPGKCLPKGKCGKDSDAELFDIQPCETCLFREPQKLLSL